MIKFIDFINEAIDTNEETRMFIELMKRSDGKQLASTVKKAAKEVMELTFNNSKKLDREVKFSVKVNKKGNKGLGTYGKIHNGYRNFDNVIDEYFLELTLEGGFYDFWKKDKNARNVLAKLLSNTISHELLHLKQWERAGGVKVNDKPRLKGKDKFKNYLSVDVEVTAFAQGFVFGLYEMAKVYYSDEEAKELILKHLKTGVSEINDLPRNIQYEFHNYKMYLEYFESEPKILNKFKKTAYLIAKRL